MANPGGATDIGPWRWVWRDVPRPFMHPVTTPAGRELTVDAPADHPWHHALWFTIKFVNGENFWEEYGDFGCLVQADPPTVERDGATVRARSAIEWQRPGSAEVVLRQRLHHLLEEAEDHLALEWTTVLTPTVDVELDRTPFTTWGGYGGLTLRGRPDWHDTELRLADGTPAARILGERSPWCALSGPLGLATSDGPSSEDDVGVVVFDHPSNPNHPTPWYASTRADTYGDDGWSNFLNAAVLWDGPLRVAAGEELVLRHRVITHDRRWDTGRIDEEWQRWVAR